MLILKVPFSEEAIRESTTHRYLQAGVDLREGFGQMESILV